LAVREQSYRYVLQMNRSGIDNKSSGKPYITYS